MIVKFMFNVFYVLFFFNLVYLIGFIVLLEVVKVYGKDFGCNLFGIGFFKFVEWKFNECVVVEWNDDYWDGLV